MSSSPSRSPASRDPRFPTRTPFRRYLQKQVDGYFVDPDGSKRSKKGGSPLVRKALVMLGWWFVSYIYLLCFAQGWLDAGLATFSLALAVAGLGFSVQHDGGHGSFSEHPKLNALAARALDFIGGSSWIWKSKHNYLHHHFTNIDSYDADLQDGSYMRLSPQQPHRAVHRFQHWYAWLLYGLLPIKWHFFDDFLDLRHQRVGAQPIALTSRKEIRRLILGKVLFFGWALIIPLTLHSPGKVILAYTTMSMVLGVLLAVVFQLAHCVEPASFVPVPQDDASLPFPWVEHQLRTTVNFAHRHPFWTWYLGGLNYQVEHHLFPQISHIHYPDLAPIVEKACLDHDLPYLSYPTIGEAIASHYRFLKKLGASA